jgi:hypothetical protein
MCGQVQLLVSRPEGKLTCLLVYEGVDVTAHRFSDTEDNLFDEIADQVDPTILSCAKSLWTDDDYPRFFDIVDYAIIISCTQRLS